ncbi:KUNITZ TRYPSIN INHIBITOR 2 [Salix koriyanagi]|uniref:KUNITZ TRYPSIN INHIBITOR 2 n=1 Tax=Salix koriyanagi TaxID=2511006 RepID=A0A9Q0UYE3_9ROSI|nr:KUNITZ TRYPSIN INHIBITOR 2 [Salix koriyanagi]
MRMGPAFVVLFFLLFAFAAKPLPRVSAAAAPETVLDVAGKILRTGTDYNILPAMRGGGGNPGPETLDNWFKIERYGNGYKLVFCPTVCDDCEVLCRDIGIYVDSEGFRRLALSDVPFKVMFKKF